LLPFLNLVFLHIFGFFYNIMKFNTYFLKNFFHRNYKKQYFLHENFVYNYRVLLNFNKMPDLFLYYSFFANMRNIIKSK